MSDTTLTPAVGTPLSRVEGRAKVMGQAQYAYEQPVEGGAYAVAIASTVAHGEITKIDAARALAVPGVLAVVSHENAPRLAEVAETRVGNFNTANWASGKILAERPDVVREVVKMQKAAAEYLSPGGRNDPANWEELLVTQFGYEQPVYEAVLENVGAEWRFDDVLATVHEAFDLAQLRTVRPKDLGAGLGNFLPANFLPQSFGAEVPGVGLWRMAHEYASLAPKNVALGKI